MTEFVEREADLSEGGESNGSADSEPAAKKPRKQKHKRRQISSDEDEEDEVEDDKRLREEMRGFVVEEDEEEEEGNEEDQDDDDDKSDKAGSDVSEDLLEDDLELLNENVGRTVGGRVEISDDEENDRERIKEGLFGHVVDEELDERAPRENRQDRYEDNYDSGSESEVSETFIVRDDEIDGDRRKRKKHQRSALFADHVLDEAKEIFGVEDLNEFYEDEEGYEEEIDEELGEGYTPARQKSSLKVSLLTTIEPSELEKGFVSAEDRKIIAEDKPERFQVRKIPVTEVDDHDLTVEMFWIYEYAFKAHTISKQEGINLSIVDINNKEGRTADNNRIDMEAPDKIKEAIKFIRNQLFEVPFIAFYRKEYVDSCLLVPDLWKVYLFDEKWCHLQQRMAKLTETLRRVDQYIQTSGSFEAERLKKVTERDYTQISMVKTAEELSDVIANFQLYYGTELGRVHDWEQQTARDNLELGYAPRFKLCGRTDKYQLCSQCGLSAILPYFGLTSQEYAENCDKGCAMHEVRRSTDEAEMVAKDYICETFPTWEDVMSGAVYMLAKQFSHEPNVRRMLRPIFRSRLKFSVYPTRKGRNEIDENHPLWNKHYIKDKMAAWLEKDEYLKYIKAKNEGLLEVELYCDTEHDRGPNGETLFKTLKNKKLFDRDDEFYVVKEWNTYRDKVLKCCVEEILVPVFVREAHEELLREAKESVLRQASVALREMIRYESYKPPLRYNAEGDEDEDVGTRVLAICYSFNVDEASFAVCIDQDGAVIDYHRLVHFTKRSEQRFPFSSDSRLKADDMKELKQLITKRLPHVICLNAENWDAIRLKKDVEALVNSLYESGKISLKIPVEIVNNSVAKVYQSSQIALDEFPDCPPMFKQAVSLARYLLDPLVEVCHLFNSNDDILFIHFHPLQNQVRKEDLLFTLQLECINRVNEVGVDINRCLEFPHTAGLLQFVCGLGPRKAGHLLKLLKQNENLLESRTKLVTFCRMGPKVFMNAAGFIKIDTAKVTEKTDSYVEVLDGSRVHPETYEWARKMAVDALEIDDPADPTAALEEILQTPERLKDLDLDAFAEELLRQGFGNKTITLYDIRAELNYRYKDLRDPREALSGQQLFEMLIKDAKAYQKDRLVVGQVLRIVYREPNDENRRKAAPKHNHQTGKWECDFCKRDTFNTEMDAKAHSDIANPGKDCPGMPIGAVVRLHCGLTAFVLNKNMSDNFDNIRDPLKLLPPGNAQYFRVLTVDYEHDPPRLDLSCKTSDLRKEGERDHFFDTNRCEAEKAADIKQRNLHMERQNTQKRVVSHPSFHNIGYKEAERMIQKMDQGDVIIRPSHKADNILTVMWKVTEDILQSLQVEERDKTSVYEIGKKLIIHGEEFEDLDEIIARHIQPMASFARDIMSYKYYMEGAHAEDQAQIEGTLRSEKVKNPTRIPYVITASTLRPGKFRLSYMLGGTSTQGRFKHEELAATPEGIGFRRRHFPSTEELVAWFKATFSQSSRQ